jgi:hypothetical protein
LHGVRSTVAADRRTPPATPAVLSPQRRRRDAIDEVGMVQTPPMLGFVVRRNYD